MTQTKPRLSIIMPCFNCAATLSEAVMSCYLQGFSQDQLEIIMVDDGSSDTTRQVIEEHAARFSNIRPFYHEKNKGGGAARNTAISQAEADVIFCLDGDDMLPDNTLLTMLQHLEKTESDGVLIQETHFFEGTNVQKVTVSKNNPAGEVIELADLFKDDTGQLVRVNFMYTKKAALAAGGYPEHHGFDTQGFGYRFLSKGMTVRVCPGAAYLHRRNNGESFFNREYKQGKFSFNMYLIFEEMLFLFSKEVRQSILSYDIFAHKKLGEDNIETMIKGSFRKNPDGFFVPEYKSLLRPNGDELYMENQDARVSKSNTQTDTANGNDADMFARAVILKRQGRRQESVELFEELCEKNPTSKIAQMNLLRTAVGDDEAYKAFQMPFEPRKIDLDFIIRNTRRILKNFFGEISKSATRQNQIGRTSGAQGMSDSSDAIPPSSAITNPSSLTLRAIIWRIKRKIKFLASTSGLVTLPRPDSRPYISGDTFRSFAKHVYDEDKDFDPNNVSENDIIFVKADMIERFFADLHPHIRTSYKLITHNSDKEIGAAEAGLLDSLPGKEKIVRWFAQNVSVIHDKITPIPIGLENWHHNRWGNPRLFTELRSEPSAKKNRIIFGFTVGNNPTERSGALDALRSSSIADEAENGLEPLPYFWTIQTYKFIAAPQGNGLDSHRLWESLLLGIIPIARRTPLVEHFKSLGLPILIIDSWQEISGLSDSRLEELYENIMTECSSSKDSLGMADYWQNVIASGN